jgi:hypothetical protein
MGFELTCQMQDKLDKASAYLSIPTPFNVGLIAKGQHSSLFYPTVIDQEKSFISFTPVCGQGRSTR